MAWALPQLLQGRFRFGLVLLLLAAGSLLWVSLRALWVRIAPPEGEEITALDAPELFQALERIRRKVKGPAIHHVLLSDEFNASIQQIPRYGLFGGGTNHLVIGLPLLMALDRGRFLSVLAHEYGHLRGDHGRFGAWIYRTRWSWMQLNRTWATIPAWLGCPRKRFCAGTFPFAAKTLRWRGRTNTRPTIAGRLRAAKSWLRH